MGILNLREPTVPSSVAAQAAARRSSLVPPLHIVERGTGGEDKRGEGDRG